MNSETVASFWVLYRKLPKKVRAAARTAYQRFTLNSAHPGLHFHRLASNEELWSVRITRNYRAVGLVDGNTVTWFWIGDHKAFDRDFPT